MRPYYILGDPMTIELFIDIEIYRKNRPMLKHIKKTLGCVNLNGRNLLPGIACSIQLSPDVIQVSEVYFVLVFKKHDEPCTSEKDCMFLDIPKRSIIDVKMCLWSTII